MSGHVAFSEGRNDAYFMQKVFKRCNVNAKITKYIAEEEDNQTIDYGQQERAMRDFRRDEQDYFVKSEGGYPGLYDVFAYSVEKIVTGQIEATLVIDLDRGPFSATISGIQDNLDDHFNGSMEWQNRECHEEVDDLWLGEATVADVNTGDSAAFSLVAFENDVETAVGCSSEDPPGERRQCIREYLDQTAVKRALVSLYG